jgi:hypothetical protein
MAVDSDFLVKKGLTVTVDATVGGNGIFSNTSTIIVGNGPTLNSTSLGVISGNVTLSNTSSIKFGTKLIVNSQSYIPIAVSNTVVGILDGANTLIFNVPKVNVSPTGSLGPLNLSLLGYKTGSGGPTSVQERIILYDPVTDTVDITSTIVNVGNTAMWTIVMRVNGANVEVWVNPAGTVATTVVYRYSPIFSQ